MMAAFAQLPMNALQGFVQIMYALQAVLRHRLTDNISMRAHAQMTQNACQGIVIPRAMSANLHAILHIPLIDFQIVVSAQAAPNVLRHHVIPVPTNANLIALPGRQ
jgi:hypothetical protein